MRLLFMIGAGGFIGTVARYLFQQGISKLFPVLFPLGTLAINLTGCFLIGVIYALTERWNILTPEWRIFLTTGFCGGFTTFSTFNYETYNMIRDDQYLYVSLYVGISIIACLALTFFGIFLIRSL